MTTQQNFAIALNKVYLLLWAKKVGEWKKELFTKIMVEYQSSKNAWKMRPEDRVKLAIAEWAIYFCEGNLGKVEEVLKAEVEGKWNPDPEALS